MILWTQKAQKTSSGLLVVCLAGILPLMLR